MPFHRIIYHKYIQQKQWSEFERCIYKFNWIYSIDYNHRYSVGNTYQVSHNHFYRLMVLIQIGHAWIGLCLLQIADRHNRDIFPEVLRDNAIFVVLEH